jgi:hypothetical protein
MEMPSISVHADEEEIWLSGTDGVAVPSGVPPTGSIDPLLSVLRTAKRVHVLGSDRNSAAVMNLHDARVRGTIPGDTEIVLVSPNAGGPDLSDAKRAHFCMWYARRTDRTDVRYVQLTPAEYSAAAVCSSMRESQWQITDKLRALVRYHPAWPAMSFVETLNLGPACAILSIVVDPRWFTLPFRPNRITPLQTVFGLNLANVSALLHDTKSQRPDQEACSLLVSAWLPANGDISSTGPRRFLDRIALDAETTEKGVLNASKVFLRFVREVWMQSVSGHDKMFDPKVFFKREDEWQAYEEHCAKLSPRAR